MIIIYICLNGGKEIERTTAKRLECTDPIEEQKI